ncbi:MAG: hypothetical protein DLM59_08205 [Pseudonocardiales bacterium]|nr:MAG: hypothetical protein DLM59_08205 [Pseudonocardiales bacterium]
MFFPEKGQAAKADAACRVCARCDVQMLCAITFGPVVDYGVIAGRTANQRRRHGRPAPDKAA